MVLSLSALSQDKQITLSNSNVGTETFSTLTNFSYEFDNAVKLVQRPDCTANDLKPLSSWGTCTPNGSYDGVFLGGPTTDPNVFSHKRYYSCLKNGVYENEVRECVDNNETGPSMVNYD